MKNYVKRLLAVSVSLGIGLSVSCSQLASGGGFSETIPKNKKTSLPTDLFKLTEVPTLTIEISLDDWNTLLTNFDANDRNETMVKADFIFLSASTNLHFYNVGIRIRGNSWSRVRPEGSSGQLHNSSTPDWHHAHFKLDVDQFASSPANLYGLDGLNLKWFNGDPNYAREVYCYNLFQKFGVWTAPLASYCKLYIKIKEDPTAAYFGIYEMIEPIDKNFIKVRFKNSPTDDNGFLWKCLYTSGGPANLSIPLDIDMGCESIDPINEGNSYRPPYDLKTYKTNLAAAKVQLLGFINNLNSKTGTDFQTWISQAMDIDLLLRAYAVNTLVGMWDDYWKNANNYYLYFDDLGKCYFIPYDYDNTLGNANSGFGDPGITDIINWGNPANVLMTKVMGVTEFKNTYIKYVSELINKTNDLFDFVKSTNRIKIWQNMISADVANDTGDDMVIYDAAPGGGGYCSYYQLFSGGIGTNYFKTRIVYAQLQLGLPTNANSWVSTGGGGDTTAPLFDTPPTLWFSGGDRVSFYWKLNESGKIYYVIVADGSPAPTSSEVKLGKASGGGAPITFGSLASSNPANYYYLIGTGLTIGTSYDIYAVAEDVAAPPNLQASPSLLNMTTAGYISPEILSGSVIFRYKYTGSAIAVTNIYLRGEPANNDWNNGLLMTYDGGGMFSIVRLKPSQTTNGEIYKFVHINGTTTNWITDPVNPYVQDDGWGGYNSVVWN